jgi:hypothetical protein
VATARAQRGQATAGAEEAFEGGWVPGGAHPFSPPEGGVSCYPVTLFQKRWNRKSHRDRAVGRSQRTGLEGGRKGGGAFEGGWVPVGVSIHSPLQGGGVTLLPCYLFPDGVQDIAALAASVVAQGEIRHVSDRAPLRASAALRPGAEVGRGH